MDEQRFLRRNDPLREYITQIYAGNGILPGCAYKGLDSASFEGLTPFLNIREILSLAPTTWQFRDGEMLYRPGQDFSLRQRTREAQDAFVDAIERGSLFDAFSAAFRHSSTALTKRVTLTDLDERLNPYSASSLRDRLNAVDRDSYDEAIALLASPVPAYLFPCSRNVWKHDDVRMLAFQTEYPRPKTTGKLFIDAVARRLRSYKSWDVSFDEPTPLPPMVRQVPAKPSVQQLPLF